MRLQEMFATTWRKIQKLPRRYVMLFVGIVATAGLYYGVFGITKQVSFSYAGDTCVKQFVLFPQIYDIQEDAIYEAQYADPIQIGDFTIASRSLCFVARQSPQPGTTTTHIAPHGSLLFRKTFAVTTPISPVANLSVFEKPVSSTLPLKIELDTTDKVFEYSLRVGNKQSDCIPGEKEVSCNVKPLDMRQGASYDVQLIRQFNNAADIVLASKKVETLAATRVVKTSIRKNSTIYTKPKTISVVFDKKLKNIDTTLYRIKDGKKESIFTETVANEKNLKINLQKDLPRSSNYELIVKSAEAQDGSSLEEPYRLLFKMSGGPKVTGVNVGQRSVPLNSTVTIDFDQPLSDKQDTNKAVKITGGGKIVGKRGSQLFVSLADVPKCGDFTVKVANNLESKHGVAGGSAWSYTARMVCHGIETIGYSNQGRAINAYVFGGGSASVLYTGAIHGNELSTRYLMERWIAHLEANARSIPNGKTVAVVPQINPDGVANGTRVNARNVDLNRNFATSDWRKDVTTVNNQPFPGGGGKSAMSEPETQAIAAYAQRLRPLVIASYHSIGGVVAANQAGNSGALASMYSRLSGFRNVTGQTDDTFEYSVSGTADDWYAQRLGIPSLLIELGSHTYHQFESNKAAMWELLKR